MNGIISIISRIRSAIRSPYTWLIWGGVRLVDMMVKSWFSYRLVRISTVGLIILP